MCYDLLYFLHRSNIKHYFPAFEGEPENLLDVQNFLVSLFHERKKEATRLLFHHFTTGDPGLKNSENRKIPLIDVAMPFTGTLQNYSD